MNTGKTSDREMEALAVMGLDDTMKELSTWRADYMDAKSVGYQVISTLGTVSDEDIPIDDTDSVAKSTLNAYLTSALIGTNIINKDYMLPKTLADRKVNVVRETE